MNSSSSLHMHPIFEDDRNTERACVDTGAYMGYMSDTEKHSRDESATFHNSDWATQSMYIPRSQSQCSQDVAAIKLKLAERLRRVKEEQERLLEQKRVKYGQTKLRIDAAVTRVFEERRRKLEDHKKRTAERQRMAAERRKMLQEADQEKRKKYMHNNSNISSTDSTPRSAGRNSLPSNSMTTSCYGITGHERESRNRFIKNRPKTGSGRVFGFGSSCPRNICEKEIKPKRPSVATVDEDSRSARSKPGSLMKQSRSAYSMTTSLYIPPTSNSNRKSSSLTRKSARNDTSNTTHTSAVKSKSIAGKSHRNGTSSITPSTDLNLDKKTSKPRVQKPRNQNLSPPSDSILPKRHVKHKQLKYEEADSSGPADSLSDNVVTPDSMDLSAPEECDTDQTYFIHKTRLNHPNITAEHISPPTPTPDVTSPHSTPVSVNNGESLNAPPLPVSSFATSNNSESSPVPLMPSPRASTKDLTEVEYKARMAEQRRLVREKREHEKMELKRLEMERRKADQLAAQELMQREAQRQEELRIQQEQEENERLEAARLQQEKEEKERLESKIPPNLEIGSSNNQSDSSQCMEDNEEQPSSPKPVIDEAALKLEEQNRLERKKRLESIMSRVKRPNPDSSATISMSQSSQSLMANRAASPDPFPDSTGGPDDSVPKIRSSVLDKLMTTGKLSGMSSVAAVLKRNARSPSSELLTEDDSSKDTDDVNRDKQETDEDYLKFKQGPVSKSRSSIILSLTDNNSQLNSKSLDHDDFVNGVAALSKRGSCDGQEDTSEQLIEPHAGMNGNQDGLLDMSVIPRDPPSGGTVDD